MPQANPSGGANSERLENVTFPQARIDINDNFEALQTLNSGNSEPSTKAAFMQWLDTSSDPAILKVRNSTNSSWIEVGSLSTTAYAPKGITDIPNGGTGEITAAAAIAALLPTQGESNAGKSLTTNGSVLSWALSSIFHSYTFNYTGSAQNFTVPDTGNLAFIFLWGGGGSGASNDSGAGDSGGGGGGCCFGIFPLSQLGSANTTISMSIGQGGQAPGNDSSGNSGGNSTFGSPTDSFYLKANGGEGGVENGRGGYGGQIFDLGYANSSNGGMIGGFSGGNGGTEAVAGRSSIFGGGGGGGGWDSASAHPQGQEVVNRGGYSVMGGNGGRGGGQNGNATYQNADNGAVPGGGGGGRAEGSVFSVGGNGQCKIYII